MKSLLVPDDFNGYKLASLVVDTPYYLAETALSEEIDDFVSVGEMIAFDDIVITSFVVISKISGGGRKVTNNLSRGSGSSKVHIRIVDNLPALKDVEID